ncbi:GNAT family N-acetyltransferase [Granulicella sp. dw_53]|uniref:GNAT family N-acetyltransferase n=1 Tax=Granulicella sp. dw_53 TaxID=2719792 RepID=UPI001BD32F3B|nr:GNAT family N-acetyltransferase [Granulicella sp. dw_53]
MTYSQLGTTASVPSEQLYSRLATQADAEAIVSLINLAFAGENPFFRKQRTTLEQIRAYLQKGYFLLIEEEKQIIGLMYVELRENSRAYLGFLSIHPEKQKHGIGRQVHEAAEQFCRERGYRVAEGLIINLRTDLIDRNERFGYKVVEHVSAADKLPELIDHIDGPWHIVRIEKHL